MIRTSNSNSNKNDPMTFMRTPALVGATVLAFFGASPALAQDSGWYAGGSVGGARATIDDERITSGLRGQGLGTNSIEDREGHTGYKLFGGYQLNRYFGVEAGYFDLGRFGYTAQTTPAGSLAGDMRVKGWNADLVGTLPLMGQLSALGRVGVTSVRAEDRFSATGAARVPYANAAPSQRSTNAKFGLGLAYAFSDSLSLRVEGERYRLKDAVGNRGDVDMVSVGLVYRFGGSPPPSRAAAVAPTPAPSPAQYVAAPAAPAAVVVAAAPQPVPAVVKRVSLSADSLFDFDQSAIKPAGRQSLDKLAADLRGVDFASVHVIGHTDRLGSARYNEALSSRRAAAVGEYLVRSGGVPAQKIVAQGVGPSSPVTRAADCRGGAPAQALIACLAPDRRVEVEIQGTR